MVGAGMDMNPYGANYTTRDMMYKAFVKPFVNVFDVAAGKTKEVSQAAQTAVKSAFAAIATSIIPGIKSNYDKLFSDANKKMDNIRREYADVYRVTWDAFKDNDIITAAFMFDPAAVLTSKAAAKSTKSAEKLLSVLSGGELDNFLEKLGDRFGSKGKSSLTDRTAGSSFNTWYGESVVREADEKQDKNPSYYLTNPKVVGKAVNSAKAKQMQNAAHQVVGELLNGVLEQAKTLMACNTLEEIQNKLHVKLPALKSLEKIDQSQRQAAEKTILTSTKKSMKEFYIKNLMNIINGVQEKGIPQSSKFVQAVGSTISKIKAM